MKQLNENIAQHQEGDKIPSLAFKYLIVLADTEGARDTLGTILNISERCMVEEPGIVDSADYRPNFTYKNELSLKMNNEDGFFFNQNKTGVLDINKNPVIKISGYYDIPGGENYDIELFTGYIDNDKTQTDYVEKTTQLRCISNFGKSENVTGRKLTTQYIDENGLILYNTGLWLVNANVEGKVLTEGAHEITTKFEDDKYKAKLDDGEFTELAYADKKLITNLEGTQAVELCYNLEFFIDNETSTVIVTTEGNQYPETFYFYPNIEDIISAAADELGFTLDYKAPEINTYDGNKAVSYFSGYPGKNFNGNCNSIVSDGGNKIYLSVNSFFSNSASVRHEIWEYKLIEKVYRKIYSTDFAYNGGGADLLSYQIFYSNGFLYALTTNTDVTTSNIVTIKISTLAKRYLGIDTDKYEFNHIVFCESTSMFYLCMKDKTNNQRGFYTYNPQYDESELDDPRLVRIYRDDSIIHLGCQFVHDTGTDLYFYFVISDAGTLKLHRMRNNGSGWDDKEYVCDWFDLNEAYYSYNALANKTLFIFNSTHTVYKTLNLDTNAFTTITPPEGYKIYAAYCNENDASRSETLYCLLASADKEAIGIIKDGKVTLKEELTGFKIVKGNPAFTQVKRFCTINFNDEQTIIFATYHPGVLLKYSSSMAAGIKGEYNTADKTLREVLQEICNNYLLYMRVTTDKKLIIRPRENYKNDSGFVLKKDYIKSRTDDRNYGEVYSMVKVSNGDKSAEYGVAGVENKVLDLSLELLPNGFLKYMAKKMLDYYTVVRKIVKIQYIPTYFNLEALDSVDMTEMGENAGVIHRAAPKDSILELDILTEVINE